ncbi:MAG: Holliday junction branch migration protein RuvA, partial [Helicobacter sp.]|nr:Holliday junction branch migration protein RuvA [Helicobacter sp.]
MIVGLHGHVIHQTPTALWVQTQGIVYEVFVPLRILAQQLSDVRLFTTHIVREDAMSLYGFLELDEKIFFDRVIR